MRQTDKQTDRQMLGITELLGGHDNSKLSNDKIPPEFKSQYSLMLTFSTIIKFTDIVYQILSNFMLICSQITHSSTCRIVGID